VTELLLVIDWAVVIVFLAFAGLMLWKLAKTDLGSMVMELDGSKVSLSRFQFLIFTFAVAGLFIALSFESGALIAVSADHLGLLGISSGSYLISKGIGSNASTGS
jgi:hypothetical protein